MNCPGRWQPAAESSSEKANTDEQLIRGLVRAARYLSRRKYGHEGWFTNYIKPSTSYEPGKLKLVFRERVEITIMEGGRWIVTKFHRTAKK